MVARADPVAIAPGTDTIAEHHHPAVQPQNSKWKCDGKPEAYHHVLRQSRVTFVSASMDRIHMIYRMVSVNHVHLVNPV